MTAAPSDSPIGVFDSGLGGLSVVREMQRLLPREHFVYIGDTAHVPYGPRDPAEVRAFSLAIACYLTHRRGCRVIVVPCNTATSAAAAALRSTFSVPIVAIEPGIKPAVAATRSGWVGVLATQGTLTGDRFALLVERFAGGVEVITQPCPGLVECVERGDLDGDEPRRLVEQYVRPLTARGVDTLVLGCTHYPYLLPLIADAAGPGVTIIDTGPAVARQVARVAPPNPLGEQATGCLECWTTGDTEASMRGIRACLGDSAVAPRRLYWREGELYEDATN